MVTSSDPPIGAAFGSQERVADAAPSQDRVKVVQSPTYTVSGLAVKVALTRAIPRTLTSFVTVFPFVPGQLTGILLGPMAETVTPKAALICPSASAVYSPPGHLQDITCCA